jgi:hypothetical protein
VANYRELEVEVLLADGGRQTWTVEVDLMANVADVQQYLVQAFELAGRDRAFELQNHGSFAEPVLKLVEVASDPVRAVKQKSVTPAPGAAPTRST